MLIAVNLWQTAIQKATNNQRCKYDNYLFLIIPFYKPAMVGAKVQTGWNRKDSRSIMMFLYLFWWLDKAVAQALWVSSSVYT